MTAHWRTGCIYALCEPDCGTVRYVGKTVRSPKVRRREHIREAVQRERQSQVHRWVRGLVGRGTGPALWVLEEGVSEPDLFMREVHWIAAFKSWGTEMLNYTNGGNGASQLSQQRIRRLCSLAAVRPRCPDTGRFLAVNGVPA